MKNIILITCFAFISLHCFSQEITTYYFIRHAEKVRTDRTNKNPVLNKSGVQRAKVWKEVFSKIPLDAVYSTKYLRTQMTVKPTADSKNLRILSYNPKEMYSEKFQKMTKGKSVLIVGHSNTTNVFANKVLGEDKYPEIKDDNNSNLYIVTINDGKISSILLKIN